MTGGASSGRSGFGLRHREEEEKKGRVVEGYLWVYEMKR